jgi:hypothetical protein
MIVYTDDVTGHLSDINAAELICMVITNKLGVMMETVYRYFRSKLFLMPLMNCMHLILYYYADSKAKLKL